MEQTLEQASKSLANEYEEGNQLKTISSEESFTQGNFPLFDTVLGLSVCNIYFCCFEMLDVKIEAFW